MSGENDFFVQGINELEDRTLGIHFDRISQYFTMTDGVDLTSNSSIGNDTHVQCLDYSEYEIFDDANCTIQHTNTSTAELIINAVTNTYQIFVPRAVPFP